MPDPRFHSIVMPAYNEQDVIQATVEQLCDYLNDEGFEYELVIVDDASTDDTASIISELARKHRQIRPVRNSGPNGYGHAIRRGLAEFRGDDMVIVTSDGSDTPQDVATYFRKIDEADCVFGSRFDGNAQVTGYPPFKKALNRVANTLVGWLVRSRYRDFTNGFKCYRREVIEGLMPIASGQFNITIELSVGAVLAGHSYVVVPTDWHQRDAGVSSFKIFRMIRPYAATLLYCMCRNYLKKTSR